jgi:hypothetical protein
MEENETGLKGRELTIHNERVKLAANHLDRFASSMQTSFILGSVIKALTKDAGIYDMVIAAGLFILGLASAAVLYRYAKRKLGELE